MPPIDLAWALLFVVAFSVIYRFFTWLGRSLGRKAADAPSPIVAVEPPPSIEHAAPPAPTARPPAPTKFAAPLAEAVRPPSQTPTAAPVVPARDVPLPTPARTFAAATAPADVTDDPRKPLASSPVISARTATAVRTALAPSVAATLPRLKPSVEATLPPKTADLSSAPQPVQLAPVPLPVPPSSVVAAPEPIAESTPAEPATLAAPPSEPANRMRPSARLLARRVGAEVAALDIRLRDTRERKIRREPKAPLKPSLPSGGKELKVLVVKDTPGKISARRADQIGRAISIGSRTPGATKARTKIVGVSRHLLRVLEAPVPLI